MKIKVAAVVFVPAIEEIRSHLINSSCASSPAGSTLPINTTRTLASLHWERSGQSGSATNKSAISQPLDSQAMKDSNVYATVEPKPALFTASFTWPHDQFPSKSFCRVQT